MCRSCSIATEITAFAAPTASGGNGTLSYGAAGLPEGVTLSPTLQLSGTPLAPDSAYSARNGEYYFVGDSSDTRAA